MTTPEFDLTAAHRHFSAACFNGVGELIDKPDRSPDEDRLMVSMAHASLYHWQQRPDCTSRSLSVGYWQLSRVYALLGQADNARQHAQLCLAHSQNEEPFYLGYAYEALARASTIAGLRMFARTMLAKGREQATLVNNDTKRDLLESDLATVVDSAEQSHPGLMSFELNAIRESLIAEIHKVFQGVSRVGGISWSEADVIDGYGTARERKEARRGDTETNWAELVDDPNWRTCTLFGGFSFLDPIGFHYYLPPVLIRCLRGDEEVPMLDCHLSDVSLDMGVEGSANLALLDGPQRRCVARCVLYFARETDSVDGGLNEWRELLNSGWQKYLDD